MFLPFRDLNPVSRTPVATIAIIAINVVCLLALDTLDSVGQQEAVCRYGFIPARVQQLRTHRPLEVPIYAEVMRPFTHEPIQVVDKVVVVQPSLRATVFSVFSCMFLHGGWVHLIGNMWFFWIFGDNVEDRLGSAGFVLFYLVGGVVATASHWFFDPASTTPVIGASGAVAGVLGAYAITWPWASVRTLVFLIIFVTFIDVPALLVLGVWFVTQLAEGMRQVHVEGVTAGVAWWAHVGGFLYGMALMPLAGGRAGPQQFGMRNA